MADWYYYDFSGRRQGPVDSDTLKRLALLGEVVPYAQIETEDGRKSTAGRIHGLEFSALLPASSPIPTSLPNPPLRSMMNYLNRLPKSALFAVTAGAGGFIANLLSEFTLKQNIEAATIIEVLAHTAIWSALICTGIVLAIVVLQNVLLRKSVFSQSAIIPLLVGGIIGGGISGGLAQFFYSVSAAFLFADGITPMMLFLHSIIARSIAWAMMGSLAAFGMSFCIPNLNRMWAVTGGLIGGVLGCVFFLIICMFTGDWLGRLIGMAILGTCIGVMIGFVEKISRNIWLNVVYGPNELAQVNLGAQLVTVGSGRKDTVFINGVGPNAGSFRLEGEKVRYTDLTGSRLLTPGSRIQVGNVTLIVLSKNALVYNPKPSSNKNGEGQSEAATRQN